jgi:hypothetical protein
MACDVARHDPYRACMNKSNLQSKEKQTQTVTPPPPKAVVPKMWLSWNEVFRWCQTLARPSLGRNKKRLSSDQWTRLHVRIVHPNWSSDQSNRAWRWRNVNCGRCKKLTNTIQNVKILTIQELLSYRSDNSSPKNGLGILCEAWRGVLQNFTINAVDILVIDFYALHIRTIAALKSS